jgi:hypothetical protein
MLEALLAGEGLQRVAEIAAELVGAPVEVLIPRPGSDGSDGSATERYVAELVAGGDPAPPAEVGGMVPIASAGELQGAVVMLGEGSPGAEAHLRTAAVASLTGVAMLNAREDATRTPGAALLAELLAGAEIPPSEIVRRARMRGCDLSDGVIALCLDAGERPPGSLIATIAAARPDALADFCDGRIYILLPGTIEQARKLTAQLGERATTALSSRYRQAGDARFALEEAELLLVLAAAGGRATTDRPTWDSLRILFRTFIADPEELTRFSERTVGALIRHDQRHGSELQETFWIYQESNCNMNLAAKAAFTHRHTISNRLSKIEELTGLDPSRSYDRELLSMALKAHLVVSLSRPR